MRLLSSLNRGKFLFFVFGFLTLIHHNKVIEKRRFKNSYFFICIHIICSYFSLVNKYKNYCLFLIYVRNLMSAVLWVRLLFDDHFLAIIHWMFYACQLLDSLMKQNRGSIKRKKYKINFIMHRNETIMLQEYEECEWKL